MLSRVTTRSLTLLAAMLLLPMLAFAQVADTPTWQVDAGDAAYLGTGNTERGAAFNPATGNFLVASRASGNIEVLSATDGSFVSSLDMTGISGGIFTFNQVAVTDEGVIYTANLDLDGADGGVKVYRWADESAMPTVVFDGSTNVAGRVGDALGAASGDGFDYVFLSGSGNTNVTVFEVTEDGGTFSALIDQDITVASGAARGGMAAFTLEDEDDDVTFLAINGFGTPTQIINLGDTSEVYTIDGGLVPGATMNIDAISDGEFAYLAMGPGSNEEFYIVDVTDPTAPGVVATTAPVTPATPNANGNKTGAVSFDTVNGQLIAFSTNNSIAAFAFTTQVQAIHNSAFAPVEVDIYINGELAIDDLDFREATGFITLPALANLTFDVALGDSESADDAFYTIEGAAGLSGPMVLVATGNPFADEEDDDAFGLAANSAMMMAGDDTMVGLLVFHGSPDAGPVDVNVAGTDVKLADDLGYMDFTDGYASVAPARYTLDVTPSDSDDVVASFLADTSTLGGGVAVVLASGFVSPDLGVDGTEDDEPGFGLLAVLPDGSSTMLPMVVSIAQARELAVPMAFEMPVAVDGIVTRARGRVSYIQDSSMDEGDGPDGISTFASGGSYFDAIENGDVAAGDMIKLVGVPSSFNDLQQISFPDTFYVMSRGNMLPSPQMVTLAELAANGEDYESELVTVEGFAINPTRNGQTVPDTEFDDNNSYQISQGDTPEGEVELRITRAQDSELGGTAIPAMADFTGVVGDFRGTYQLFPILQTDLTMAMPMAMAQVQVIHNSPDAAAATVDVSVNGATVGQPGYLDDVDYQSATGYMMLPAGETTLTVFTADGATEVFSKTVTLMDGMDYVVVAAGIVAANGNDDDDFDLFVLPGMPMASGQTTTDVQIFHGTPDAPTIDVREVDGATLLADDLSFGEWEPYQALQAVKYTLDVETGDGSDIVSRFDAPLTQFAQQTVTILATGMLSMEGSSDQTFGLLIVDNDGNASLLTLLSGTDTEAAGELPADFALRGAFPNPAAGAATLAFDLPSAGEVSVDVYDVMGRRVMQLPARALAAGATQQIALDASTLAAGTYLYRVTATLGDDTQVRTGRLTLVR